MRLPAIGHLGAVLALLCVDTALAIYISTIAGDFSTAMQQKASGDFYKYLAIFAGLLVLQDPVQAFYGYLRTRLALLWRKWLSTDLFGRYYSNQAHRKLTTNTNIDNPDQRMTQDVDSFCNSAIGLSISIMDSLFKVLSFIGVLWVISRMLTGGVLAYAAAGSFIAVLIGKSLVYLAFQQTKNEADLRYKVASARNEAESIAFCKGEPIALSQAVDGLKRVIDTLLSIAIVNRNIQTFSNLYNSWMPLIPPLVMFPFYFRGEIEFGMIAQATIAFTAIFNGATLLIGQFSGISGFAANINRLGSFIEALDDIKADKVPEGPHIEVTQGKDIVFDSVSVFGPNPDHPIVANLNLRIPAGSSLLVTGPHPAQTSAFVRVMAGFWNAGSGRLQRPSFNDSMFIPLEPYLPESTLREILSVPTGVDDARVQQVLQSVKLGHLLDTAGGFEKVQNWKALLTKSEIHRLVLARIVLGKRDCVVCDEVTYAVEPGENELLYAILGTLGSTIITVGQPSQLAQYHDQVLELLDDGTWRVYPAKKHLEFPKLPMVNARPLCLMAPGECP
jgi:vitamin B12/bleomycin/antimicrobial peptide transport system ATP-binding/permease protein